MAQEEIKVSEPKNRLKVPKKAANKVKSQEKNEESDFTMAAQSQRNMVTD